MVNILAIVLGTVVVSGLGMAIGYLIWLKTRPKKMTWKARVYQPGKGIRPLITKDGKPVSKIRLVDLKPYTKDVIEKVERSPGITVYQLVKLEKSVPAVTTDAVEFWGEKEKEVSVLLEDENATILTKGYDKETGNLIFRPMPHSRINMIKGEVATRKDRLRREKSLLEAVTPFVVAGILAVSLFAIAYIIINGFVQMSENISNSQQIASANNKEAAQIVARAIRGETIEENIQKEEPPPTIEG